MGDSNWSWDYYCNLHFILGVNIDYLNLIVALHFAEIQWFSDANGFMSYNNMVYNNNDKVQRGHSFAIVDEVDSILIDEARTPLIISGPPSGTTGEYESVYRAVVKINQNSIKIYDFLM